MLPLFNILTLENSLVQKESKVPLLVHLSRKPMEKPKKSIFPIVVGQPFPFIPEAPEYAGKILEKIKITRLGIRIKGRAPILEREEHASEWTRILRKNGFGIITLGTYAGGQADYGKHKQLLQNYFDGELSFLDPKLLPLFTGKEWNPSLRGQDVCGTNWEKYKGKLFLEFWYSQDFFIPLKNNKSVGIDEQNTIFQFQFQ